MDYYVLFCDKSRICSFLAKVVHREWKETEAWAGERMKATFC
jgi:hypothetical protein